MYMRGSGRLLLVVVVWHGHAVGGFLPGVDVVGLRARLGFPGEQQSAGAEDHEKQHEEAEEDDGQHERSDGGEMLPAGGVDFFRDIQGWDEEAVGDEQEEEEEREE